MLFQIHENIWIETDEIQSISPYWVNLFPDGEYVDFDTHISEGSKQKHGGEPKKTAYTKVKMRNNATWFIYFHPQIFVQTLKDICVPFADNSSISQV